MHHAVPHPLVVHQVGLVEACAAHQHIELPRNAQRIERCAERIHVGIEHGLYQALPDVVGKARAHEHHSSGMVQVNAMAFDGLELGS